MRQHVALTNCHDRNWRCHPASCPVPAWLLAVCFAFYPSLLRERALGVSTARLPVPPGAQVKSTEPRTLMQEQPEVLPASATAEKNLDTGGAACPSTSRRDVSPVLSQQQCQKAQHFPPGHRAPNSGCTERFVCCTACCPEENEHTLLHPVFGLIM